MAFKVKVSIDSLILHFIWDVNYLGDPMRERERKKSLSFEPISIMSEWRVLLKENLKIKTDQ